MELKNGSTSQCATTTNSGSYSEIILTDDETAEALRQGRKDKYHKLKYDEWRKSLSVTYEPVKMDARELRAYILKCFPDLKPELQKEQFDKLIDYFTGNEEKGLMLIGGVGCGKTTLMKSFEWNPKASYAVKSCNEISELFAASKGKDGGGYEAIKFLKGLMNGQRNDFNQTDYGICFDDFGTETVKKHFGNESNVMEEILLARYQKKELWKYTHITTNLNAKDIIDNYGERVASRMREMFHQIPFKGINDLRK